MNHVLMSGRPRAKSGEAAGTKTPPPPYSKYTWLPWGLNSLEKRSYALKGCIFCVEMRRSVLIKRSAEIFVLDQHLHKTRKFA